MSQTTLPDNLLALLDGSLPASHLHQAIRLASIGENGWPYAAQLSLGEIIARSANELLFAIWPQSTTTGNLRRNGKITLALVLDGAVMEIQAQATPREETLTDLSLAVFHAEVKQVIAHRAPYATVTSGLTFTLKDETAALARWRQQIMALKALA
ncbi:pyridoxamine 5'-phosphate oxidase family protein [Erwinia sorbitola]|uniref:Pyridoxamine 5-phosphate oxidase n=1 Tax=Erwinia sorbitola TaxID=2681984 RepID=A0A6I6EP34_9GAMM|nr:pyridoxamine 5'-phosphate oxidase family protein [Erwinia sorbitola]MTD26894.1 pyridoxamine 5-phosphate oxidase [Erwinia sorbitola]QGU88461.1 pyridoxamine 5-phosphate oxidase [Erwinia sorbitola]